MSVVIFAMDGNFRVQEHPVSLSSHVETEEVDLVAILPIASLGL